MIRGRRRRSSTQELPTTAQARPAGEFVASVLSHLRQVVDVGWNLLDVDAETARGRLAGEVFEEPGTGVLVPKTTYLSGNVRAKLAAAREAMAEDGVDITSATPNPCWMSSAGMTPSACTAPPVEAARIAA